MRWLAGAMTCAGIAWLCGCAQQPQATPQTSASAAAPAEFPAAFYRQALAQGRPVYRVAASDSLVTIIVRRAGSLARLGHDHVVASHGVQGYAAPRDGRADLYLPLAELVVDEPALRAEAGFDTQPSAADIAGTRTNMLDKVLEVERFPSALIRVGRVDQPTGKAAEARLDVAITLHGRTRSFDVPVQMQMQTEGDALRVRGELAFAQTDFGIVPLSILGGAIQVQDGLLLRFDILARRVAAMNGAGGAGG
jgi:hypothetical protein